jgi:hypothetical protein
LSGHRPISHLELRFQVVPTLNPGAAASEILYTWREEGRVHHALTRLRTYPSGQDYERAAFLRRNDMVES